MSPMLIASSDGWHHHSPMRPHVRKSLLCVVMRLAGLQYGTLLHACLPCCLPNKLKQHSNENSRMRTHIGFFASVHASVLTITRQARYRLSSPSVEPK
jgi:hypothetical protein